MEVVRKNFNETLPLVRESIEKADFLSIDTEFTGLLNGRDVSMFDSPEDYYVRLLNGSAEFMLIQYGLCAFYWDEEKKQYMNDAYNFYLFPRGRPGPDRLFLCQSSSLDFLASNGFDFNKLIREGISYMPENTETRLRETLTERQSTYSREKDTIRIPDEHRQLVEEICERVGKFIKENKENEMEVDRCNAFIRLLLFQELRSRFKDQIVVDTKVLENKTRVLKVMRKTDDMEDQDAVRKKREWDELEDAVGFSKVARMISQSAKLVIGHNMLLDLLHTLGHFFQQPPYDYKAFKEFANCMFPKLLDTKYMSSMPPFKDKVTSSVLNELLITFNQKPFSLPKVGSVEGRGYSRLDDKEHEAGYDAYITGLCFLAMLSHLSPARAARCDVTLPALQPYMNKLFLAKTARQDSPYINLVGDDPSPSRDHVFHMVFPKEWQRSDINHLFSPFGQITVQFLDESSAFVALERRDQAASVARALANNSRVKLTPFDEFKANGESEMAHERSDRPKLDTYKITKISDAKPRQVVSNLPAAPQLPQKVSRERTRSATSSPPPAVARKRTSSGVFQVDELEPVAKKIELGTPQPRSADLTKRQKQAATSGKHKKTPQTKETPSNESSNPKDDKIQIIDKFDSEAKSNCVSAFKESDKWD
ncbi:unnamed protein product [Chrysodeixis includens]|uniref:Poly(A)-specific ribonuclease RNA-binding domain-containing protein n=1 Tax=Chrysodeixis includens TaxID=689277 RepID=A0A9P0BPJ4_CHRIL|nr:unnamed protein product [Chrysodeixis includens]